MNDFALEPPPARRKDKYKKKHIKIPQAKIG
jgi:hypothetical protein